jgi:hypothetical protein
VYRAKVYRAKVYRAKVYRAKVYRAKVYRAKVYRAKVYRAKVHIAKIQGKKRLKFQSKGSKLQKCKPLQQGILFIWSQSTNILDFSTLELCHFGSKQWNME